MATKHGIKLKRVDFSDPRSGKGSCDRKAATIKSHMRIYVNAGHDIETASQMMTAIESSGGMAGVSMTMSGPQPTAKSAPVKWEGVSFINNIEYSNDGMRVWRAYGIGCGKFLPWSNFRHPNSSPLPRLKKLADNASSDVSFETIKARQRPEKTTELASASEKDSDEEKSETRSGLFHCPEEGCVKSFQQYSSLEKQLDCDTHKYALEHETLYDKAMIMYTAKLEHGAGVVPETVNEDVIISANISKAMRRVKCSDGSSIFEKDDFLTPLQIAGFFSRLTAKKNYSTGSEDVERHEANKEDIQELTEEVMKTFALQHPIMFEKYNICEIVCQSKLSKFSVQMLELDVSSIPSKRKKPIQALELDVFSPLQNFDRDLGENLGEFLAGEISRSRRDVGEIPARSRDLAGQKLAEILAEISTRSRRDLEISLAKNSPRFSARSRRESWRVFGRRDFKISARSRRDLEISPAKSSPRFSPGSRRDLKISAAKNAPRTI